MPGPYRHIACGLDGSEASRQALSHAVQLRDQLHADRLRLLHVIPMPVTADSYYPIEQTRSTPETPDWLTALANATPGSEIAVIDSMGAYPPSGATVWAREEGVDLLVVATHRGIFHRMTAGSFASYLAYHAPCPVVMVPAQPPPA